MADIPEDVELTTEARTLLAAGGALCALPDTDMPIALIPEGYTVEDLEDYMDRPVRKRESRTLRDADSFGHYCKDHGDSASRLYADIDKMTATAVLDDHLPDGGARWRVHQISFAPPKHPDWVAWRERDGKLTSQGDFAQFLEDQQHRVVAPEGAELLELCQDLELTAAKAFRSRERLDSGAFAFHLAESVTQKPSGLGPDGPLELPATFRLQLPIFRHGAAVPIDARLRWRLKEGQLLLGYRLVRALEAEEEAFRAQLEVIVEMSDLVVLW